MTGVPASAPKVALYLDQDGVFADFDGGLRKLGFEPGPELNRSRSVMTPEQRERKDRMYRAIAHEGFFARLPLLEGAERLWGFCRQWEPIIVTAVPRFDGIGFPEELRKRVRATACREKFEWWPASLEGVPESRFFATTSAEKPDVMRRFRADMHVLVDDRPANVEAWRAAGGIAVHHEVADATVRALGEILPPSG